MKQQQDAHDFKAQHDLTRALLGGGAETALLPVRFLS